MKTKLLALLLTLTMIAAVFPAMSLAAVPYNANDVAKLKTFASQADNLTKLGWNFDNPESWDYVTWTEVDGEYRLEKLSIFYKNLDGTLDLSGCSAMEQLICSSNQLTSLDLSDCSALKQLICSINQLISLDLSNCSALEGLYCYNNQLISLDLSNCSALLVLECYDNKLTSLDLSVCSALKYLYCFNNQLTSLNVTGCTDLQNVNCSYNKLTTVIGTEDATNFISWNEPGKTPGTYFLFSPQNPNYVFDDVDGDEEITAADALLALKFAIGFVEPTNSQKQAADIDNDDNVTINDVMLILQYVSGKINSLE
jgi:hypothetical protein